MGSATSASAMPALGVRKVLQLAFQHLAAQWEDLCHPVGTPSHLTAAGAGRSCSGWQRDGRGCSGGGEGVFQVGEGREERGRPPPHPNSCPGPASIT